VSREARRKAPLVVHVIHRLAVGGLENGVVNLVNNMPAARFRHAIVCLTDYTDFRKRIRREDVAVLCVHKGEGKDLGAYGRLWKLLREMRPDILHTRTMAALDSQVCGVLAGVSVRIHGEHGQVSSFMNEAGLKQRLLRHVFRPFVDHYTVVSKDLATYLTQHLGIAAENVTQIYNGVDTARFFSRRGSRPAVGPAGFLEDDSLVVGTVGRVQPVKNQICLIRALIALRQERPELAQKLRFVLLGDGPLLPELRRLIDEAGFARQSWLPGERDDVAEVMRAMDIFVLPSLAEGTCNTILEAMATGLPVIASRVGGNPELVNDGRTGRLVRAEDETAIGTAIADYLKSPSLRCAHGIEGRRTVEQRFSLISMVNSYMSVYDCVLSGKSPNTDCRREAHAI
jgi:sugar transferase (PEP-CTERM/EpsH1 system associated)